MSHLTSKISEKSAGSFLTPERIQSARRRRGLTKTELARRMQLTAKTIAKYENEGAPPEYSRMLAEALGFPETYFSGEPLPAPTPEEINFRAGRRANAKERQSAAEIAPFGDQIVNWIEQRFRLPIAELPDFQDESPRIAARLLRASWGLGSKPLPNLVQLCESKGIRVFGLPILAESVDAYSTWISEKPFIFIARRKTPERTRFDMAHELGHLVLHHSVYSGDNPFIESQANEFASEFLMPQEGIIEYLPPNPSVNKIIEVKNYFKVSAMALAYSAKDTGRMSEWSYRQACIELTRRGFRTGEPEGMHEHETSRIFSFVLAPKRRPEITVKKIAEDLNLPESDVHALTFGIELRIAREEAKVNREGSRCESPTPNTSLRLVT